MELATIGELQIRLGDKEELRISADDNLLTYFEAGKDGDTLRIGTRRGVSLRPSRPVRYTLTVKGLEFIGLSSSGDATAPALTADHFEIRVSSSGDYHGESVRSAQVTVRLNSSGNARLWAEESLDATLSSSGSVYYNGDPELFDSYSSSGPVRRIR